MVYEQPAQPWALEIAFPPSERSAVISRLNLLMNHCAHSGCHEPPCYDWVEHALNDLRADKPTTMRPSEWQMLAWHLRNIWSEDTLEKRMRRAASRITRTRNEYISTH